MNAHESPSRCGFFDGRGATTARVASWDPQVGFEIEETGAWRPGDEDIGERVCECS